MLLFSTVATDFTKKTENTLYLYVSLHTGFNFDLILVPVSLRFFILENRTKKCTYKRNYNWGKKRKLN